jgi:hypothetical protein
MLDNEPTRATSDSDVTPKSEANPPDAVIPQSLAPMDPTADASAPYRQFTLQYLIAALKKPSHKE